MRRLCAVSVDLDEISNYFDIHGVPTPPDGHGAHAVYDRALQRIGAFAESRRIPVTLFAVGEDLNRPESARVLRVLAERGHPVENHSYRHRYDLTQLDRATIIREIEDGARAIERVTGRWPVGFRAPGYTVNEHLFDALDAIGVRFDSSVFPCPLYYGAKAAVLSAMRFSGRVSRSVLDTPWVLTAPTRPYRPGRVWYRPASEPSVSTEVVPGLRGESPLLSNERARGFIELPIQVTPGLRLPLIGTLLGIAGPRMAAKLAAMCVGEEFVNLELHAIDFLDASEGLSTLMPYQPELCIPLENRIAALTAALDVLAVGGYTFVRLDEMLAAC